MIKMQLSIIIITYNRADQVREAIVSCLNCNLPSSTEFIVIDNASEDNTTQVIEDLKKNILFDIHYHKMIDNLGVGPARNYAFNIASGEYIYNLDDDAVIDPTDKNFFINAIEIFEKYPLIATLTTQIYDLAWTANRVTSTDIKIYSDIFKCFTPCGGSHFLRRKYFDSPVYFPNKYGYEEIATALQAHSKGYYNVFCPSLLIIHKPRVNKWSKDNNPMLYINDFSSQFAIKSILYPKIITPLLWIIYNLRYLKHLRNKKLRKVGRHNINILKKMSVDFKPINIGQFISLFKDFGISIL